MQSQQCSAAEKGKVAENWAWGEGPELDLEEKAKRKKVWPKAISSVPRFNGEKLCVLAWAFVPVEGVASPVCIVERKELRRPSEEVAMPLGVRVLASPLATH